MGSQPIRVGLVIGQLTYGGAESQVYELAKDLSRRHVVIVYCLSGSTEPYASRLAAHGVPVRALRARLRLDPFRARALAAALSEDRIQVAHAFLFIASAYTYLATRTRRGVRFIASARNCKLEPSPIRRWIMRRAFRSADAVICNSREMESFARIHYDAPQARTHVVYNGVDVEKFAIPRRPHDGYRIGTVGRIEAQKNLDLFVLAAREVARARPDTTFQIAGAGSLRSRLEQRIREFGLERRVRLVGPVTDVPNFLAELDQFWLTSDYEGTPNVVLEAMAAGVPVVATAVGGTPEILDGGRLGSLVPAGDVGGLVRSSLALIRDPSHAIELSARSRAAAASRFSIHAMVASTEGVYRAALEELR
jgi:glycosyltransferase involved in cell wall biosynthesis